MPAFEFLEEKRPNLARFVAYGNSLDETFSNVAEALMRVMTKPEKISPALARQIEIRKSSPQALLFDWLEELLKKVNVESFLVREARAKIVRHNNQFVLRAKLKGDVTSVKSDRVDRVFTFVKSFVPEDTHLEERHDGWAAHVAVRT